MPDSSDVDNALVAKLGADAPLLAIASNGVYWAGEVPAGSTRFVEVSFVNEDDEPMFGARAWEDGSYQVKMVAREGSGANVKAAAARIDTLLEGGTLTAPGYTLMVLERTSRLRYTDPDQIDSSIKFQHRGGFYRVMVCAT